MNKIWELRLGMVLAMLLLFFALPTAFAADCMYTITAYAGQPITLTATPNTPAGAYSYLWTSEGIDLSHVNTSNVTISGHVPAESGLYSITLYVYNKEAPPGTCVGMYTGCVNVLGTTYCSLCSGHFCNTSRPSSSSCPPYFNYSGLMNPYFIYHYITLDHDDGGMFPYYGVTLQESSDPDYTLDWSLLDQPNAEETTACTTVKFWITQNGTMIGTSCEREICLYYEPTADIVVWGA